MLQHSVPKAPTNDKGVLGEPGEVVVHGVEEQVILGDQHRGVQLADALVHADTHLILHGLRHLYAVHVAVLTDAKVDAALLAWNVPHTHTHTTTWSKVLMLQTRVSRLTA